MALVFDYNNIKIDFLSEPFNHSSDKYNTKLLVLPVLRYKIYAPVIEDLELNVFQKTVLSLLNKGNFDIQQINKWLNIDTQLIQMILAELSQKGFVNNGVITPTGRELIEGTFSWFNNAEDIQKDIYYVYQDIYTKELYPALMKFDPTSDFFEYQDKKISKESKGQSKEIYASLIEPKGIHLGSIRHPEVEEVFQVIKKRSPNNLSSEENIPPNLVQFLDEEATLSFLATTAYVEKNTSEINDIKVLDPFCLESKAYWLKDSLFFASLHNERLKDIFGKMLENAEEKRREQISDGLKEIKKEAIEIIDNTFDYSLNLYADLYKSVEEFYRDMKLYEYHQDGKHLKEAFKNSQTVLETLFDYVYKENKRSYTEVLKHQNNLNNLDVEIIKAKVLKMSPECQVPTWRFEKFRGLEQAMGNKALSLRPRYVSAILACWHDRENVMYKLILQKSDILVYLEKVADGRNAVGHKYKDISDSKIGQYYTEIVDIKNGLEEIIKIFLEGK